MSVAMKGPCLALAPGSAGSADGARRRARALTGFANRLLARAAPQAVLLELPATPPDGAELLIATAELVIPSFPVLSLDLVAAQHLASYRQCLLVSEAPEVVESWLTPGCGTGRALALLRILRRAAVIAACRQDTAQLVEALGFGPCPVLTFPAVAPGPVLGPAPDGAVVLIKHGLPQATEQEVVQLLQAADLCLLTPAEAAVADVEACGWHDARIRTARLHLHLGEAGAHTEAPRLMDSFALHVPVVQLATSADRGPGSSITHDMEGVICATPQAVGAAAAAILADAHLAQLLGTAAGRLISAFNEDVAAQLRRIFAPVFASST